ncbi:hypothetical protein RclHR1_04100009 [Rhizophagus clarus]|nr:hypothetical protein RclHR1_04100009 [Rhizophagus clarus]
MSSPTSKNYITYGENDNEFNINMPPTILNLKDLNSKNCKEFNIIIVGFIELKGKAFLVPPSIEMSVTAFGTNLGNLKGDLEQVALLKIDVPFIDGYIKLYMQGGMFVNLEYNLKAFGTEKEGNDILFDSDNGV